jgi:hypothetical protein
VFPGDELTISMWDTGDGEAFFTTASHTGATVIDAGRMTYTT